MPCILLRLVATVHRTLNWWIIIISIVWIRVWKESYIDIRANPIFVFLFLLLWLLEGHSCQMLHHIALDLFLLFIWWAGRSGSILQKQRRLLQHNTILLKKMRREQQQQLAVYIGRSKLHVPLPPSYALLGSISFFFFFLLYNISPLWASRLHHIHTNGDHFLESAQDAFFIWIFIRGAWLAMMYTSITITLRLTNSYYHLQCSS